MKVSHSLAHLFTSQTRLKLINLFFYSPGSLFYVRELVRLTQEEINSVRRELQNLEKHSIIQKEQRGNRLYYWSNPSHYLYYDLIILAHQHYGLGSVIQENKLKLGKIKFLFYSQEFLTRPADSSHSVDLLLVGDVSLKLVGDYIKTEESTIGREINYMIMSVDELRLRLNKRDPVMVDFFLNYPALIIGQPDNLSK
ncbi:MAG: hypothetical protein WC851_02760 [Candidatus Shapirobacteria bacterium]|jgi:hypothetical protein